MKLVSMLVYVVQTYVTPVNPVLRTLLDDCPSIEETNASYVAAKGNDPSEKLVVKRLQALMRNLDVVPTQDLLSAAHEASLIRGSLITGQWPAWFVTRVIKPSPGLSADGIILTKSDVRTLGRAAETLCEDFITVSRLAFDCPTSVASADYNYSSRCLLGAMNLARTSWVPSYPFSIDRSGAIKITLQLVVATGTVYSPERDLKSYFSSLPRRSWARKK